MKNTKRIIATVLTAVMMISMLPSSVFAAELDAYDVVEPAVEAVSVPAEEQEIESTVEDISVEDAEEVQGSSEEIETVDAADPEAADVIEDTEAPVVTEEKTTIEAEGKDYVVTVTYDASALLPDDVKVTAEEIKANAKKYDDYCDQALEAVQQENADVEELSFTRLFDIKLVDADGNPLEPASAVDVQIRLKDVESVEDGTQVVHFAGEEETPEVIEPTVENDTVAFATEGFSVYAVIGTGDFERLTVNFHNGDELIDTMYVKKSDQGSDEALEKIIYDPGAGTIPNGYAFYGWSIGKEDYSAAEPGSSIEDVRTYIKGLDFSDGDVLDVYAMWVTYYTVKYLDPDGINLGTDTARMALPDVGESVEYTVNKNYSTDTEHNFEGWHVHDGLDKIVDPAGVTADTLIKNGTTIKITGNVEFSVSAPAGHWLVFNENGKHATYNAPRFIKSGEVTSAEGLIEMTRNGYTFDGWYTGAPSTEGGDPTGQEFEFNHEISSTTTIYAKWKPATSANYTIIIWKESLTAGEYDFEETITIEGTPGQTINTVQPQGNGNGRYARINGVDKQYEGFRYDHHDTGVKIAPEGDSVVNVYYIRNTYTLTFQSRVGIGSLRFTFREITARYGVDISSYFPIQTSQGFGPFTNLIASWFNSLVRWEPQNSTTFNKEVVYIDTMPAESITFYTDRSLASEKEMYYYVEALPGQTPVRTFNGKQFVLLAGPLGARYNFFTESEDFLEINGYEKFGSEPTFNSQGQANGDTLRCYYTRKLEIINYMDGSYFDGNNRRMSTGSGQLYTATGIPYGSDISSYNKGGANYYKPADKEGYVFEGWFIDKTCTSEYTFNRMPAGTINVYAKWRQIEYRVFLRPNAGTDASLNWGSDNQATNFRVAYGDKVSLPEGIRTGYKFLGWCSDSGLTTPVYATSLIMNETTVWDAYDKTIQENFTDPSNRWGNAIATSNADVNRFWITKRYELFAKWGKVVIGADGVGVIYTAGNDGSNPPNDTFLYQDNTTAVAGSAPTANDGKVFTKWVVQRWNGTDFEDTNVKVLPGQTFEVHVDDAKIVDNETENVVSLADVTEGKRYTYTIQVRAEYEDVEEETPTHITWYKNDGSDEFYRNDTRGAHGQLKINEAVTIYGLGEDESIPTRGGYKFLGWSKFKENTGDHTGETAPNFLVYNEDDENFYNGDIPVEEVAADEVTPYDALYAIWQRRPHFTIHHSSGLVDDEVIYMDEDGYAEPYDLTKHVAGDLLYGGYYHYEGNEKGKAYSDEPGTAMYPVEDTTYYLKEVPKGYLTSRIYRTNRKQAPKLLRGMWLVTTVDEEAYTDYGFIVENSNKEKAEMSVVRSENAGLYEKIEVINTDTNATADILDPTDIYPSEEDKNARIVIANATSYLNDEGLGTGITITSYYVTPDSVKVTGRIAEQYVSPNLTLDALNRTDKSGAYSCTALNKAGASRVLSARKTFTLGTSEKDTSLTVTKVDNGKKVAQTVKEGNNTGKITWAGKTNYVFAGWYEDASYSKTADFSNVKQDMTVYAKYVKASTVKLSFAKKAVKAGEVTLKATLKISNQPDIADTAVECTYKDNAYAVEFTGVKRSSATDTYTGTVKISGLENNSAFTAVISYTTPDGTTVNTSSRTCKYNAGAVTVK